MPTQDAYAIACGSLCMRCGMQGCPCLASAGGVAWGLARWRQLGSGGYACRMRCITIKGARYTLDDQCRWHGPQPLVGVLNRLAHVKLQECSPADGFPAAVVFYDAVVQWHPQEVVDDHSLPPYHDPDNVY